MVLGVCKLLNSALFGFGVIQAKPNSARPEHPKSETPHAQSGWIINGLAGPPFHGSPLLPNPCSLHYPPAQPWWLILPSCPTLRDMHFPAAIGCFLSPSLPGGPQWQERREREVSGCCFFLSPFPSVSESLWTVLSRLGGSSLALWNKWGSLPTCFRRLNHSKMGWFSVVQGSAKPSCTPLDGTNRHTSQPI